MQIVAFPSGCQVHWKIAPLKKKKKRKNLRFIRVFERLDRLHSPGTPGLGRVSLGPMAQASLELLPLNSDDTGPQLPPLHPTPDPPPLIPRPPPQQTRRAGHRWVRSQSICSLFSPSVQWPGQLQNSIVCLDRPSCCLFFPSTCGGKVAEFNCLPGQVTDH